MLPNEALPSTATPCPGRTRLGVRSVLIYASLSLGLSCRPSPARQAASAEQGRQTRPALSESLFVVLVGEARVLVTRLSLPAVSRQLGSAVRFHEGTGEGVENVDVLCYQTTSEPRRVTLAVKYGRVLSSQEVDITLDQPRDTRCSRLTVPKAQIKTANGLFLGMTRTALIAQMGTPSADSGEVLTYAVEDTARENLYDSLIGSSRPVTYYVHSGATARFKNDTLFSLKLLKMETS